MGHVGELEVVDVQQLAVVFLALLVDLGVPMRGHVLQHGYCLLLLRAADSHTLPGRNYTGPKGSEGGHHPQTPEQYKDRIQNENASNVKIRIKLELIDI
jgi:hypothetical protein